MWFVGTFIFRCRVGDQQTGPWTVQEQIRLIDAADAPAAHAKALELGRRQEHTYRNADNELVQWNFVGL